MRKRHNSEFYWNKFVWFVNAEKESLFPSQEQKEFNRLAWEFLGIWEEEFFKEYGYKLKKGKK